MGRSARQDRRPLRAQRPRSPLDHLGHEPGRRQPPAPNARQPGFPRPRRRRARPALQHASHRRHAALLEKAAADEHGRVRLEAIVAASWLPDNAAAKKIVAIASAKPLDVWSKDVAKTAADRLNGIAEVERPEFAAMPVPAHLKGRRRRAVRLGQEDLFPRRPLRHLPSGKRQGPRPRLPLHREQPVGHSETRTASSSSPCTA